MRRILRIADFLSLIFIVWVGLALVPLSWFWYDPGQVVISNSTIDMPPRVDFSRSIKRRTLIQYHVSVRDIERNVNICDATEGPLWYDPERNFPEDADLVWWAGNDDKCWPLVSGTYISETCWTATKLFWGIIPDKTVCRTSNPFTISAISREEAEETVEQTRSLKLQVQQLEQQIQQQGADQ